MIEDKFRVLFEHSSDAHLIIDESGVIDCNDAMIRLLGAEGKHQVLALNPEDFSPEFQPDGQRSADKAANNWRIAKAQGYHRFEWVHQRLNGDPVTVEVTINPVTLNGRDALIGVWHDLTERKRAENELLRLTDNLKQANERLATLNERMKRDLNAAAIVQQSLLPQIVPDVAGAGFAWAYRPCVELAGDILNVFRLDERHVGLYVLDVSGHGAAAALLSVSASHLLSPVGESSLLRSPHPNPDLGVRLTPPAEVAARLNAHFAARSDSEQYFTMLYGVYGLDDREFRYVCAGHPGPVVCRSQASPAIERVSGFPIGVIEEAMYEENRIALHPGDRLYLYSDGVPEADGPDGEQFGLARLLDVIHRGCGRTLAESVDLLRDEVENWCGAAGLSDDLSILALEAIPSPRFGSKP